MQISRNIVNGPKSSHYVLVGIWVIVCIQKPPHHFLQTLRPLRMFKIVFRDSSLYPKQSRAFARGLEFSRFSLIFYKNFITRAKAID